MNTMEEEENKVVFKEESGGKQWVVNLVII